MTVKEDVQFSVLSTSVMSTLTVMGVSSLVDLLPGLVNDGASLTAATENWNEREPLKAPSSATNVMTVWPFAFGTGVIVAEQFGYVPLNTTGAGVPLFATIFELSEIACIAVEQFNAPSGSLIVKFTTLVVSSDVV